MPRKRDNWPKTVEQAIHILLHRLTPEAIRIVQMSTKESLPSFRANLGQNVIENFGLPANKDLMAATGKTDAQEAAWAVAEALWQKLQDEPGLGLPPPEPPKRRGKK
jgi:hypothetical protein